MNLPQPTEKYLEEHMSPESELLKKIDRETNLEVLMPRMISGPLQGAVLTAFSNMLQPKCILEIGTYTGYSAICLAQGLHPEGKLITIDKNEELETRVRGYFKEAELENRIDYYVGNAVEIVPTLKETYDLVFIDADKDNYSIYYQQVFDSVSKGGFIVADNVFWSGKVIDYELANDVDTVALREFNRMVTNDTRVENFILPIRDGLMIIRKL